MGELSDARRATVERMRGWKRHVLAVDYEMQLRNQSPRSRRLDDDQADTSRRVEGSGASKRGGRARVLIGFAIVLTMLEISVRLFASHLAEPQLWSTPEAQAKVDQIRARKHAGLAIVGSSVVDVSLDPTRLGPDAYNAALGAGSIGMVAAFTRSVVVPDLDPKTIVVGISSRELNPNAPDLAAIEQRFLDSPGERQALGTETLLDRADRLLSDVSYLSRYRTALRNPQSWFGHKGPVWDDKITRDDGMYLGFLDEPYHDDPAVLARFRNGALHRFRLGDRQLSELRSLLVDLRSQGRRVLLVAVPVTQDYVNAYPNGRADHERFLSAVRSMAQDTGVGFLSAGVWDRSLMADPLHANGAGNQRLTRLVAAALG